MSQLLRVVLDKHLRSPRGAGAALQIGIYAKWGVPGGEELAQSWQLCQALPCHCASLPYCTAGLRCGVSAWLGGSAHKFRPLSVEVGQDCQKELQAEPRRSHSTSLHRFGMIQASHALQIRQ